MIQIIASIVAAIAGAFAVCSLGYYALCRFSAARFLRERKAVSRPALGEVAGSALPTQSLPPVSILKPLKGADPEMYESLRSHCLQDYPEYEIIFGVSDPHDPALEIAARLQAEFPQRAIHLVVCDRNLGVNAKVSNLAQMLPQSRYEYLIVSDSDIRIEPDYLRRVLAPLSDPHVGLVTCLYRGIPAGTLFSRLESLGISTDFAAGVLVARQLEGGIRFGLGSTLALRRRDLEAIGGFQGFLDYLADDYQIGSHLVQRGFRVELSDVIVQTFLPAYTLQQFADHQLRWGRTIRDSRRWGYLGLVLTFGLPWSVLALLFSGGAFWAWALLAIATLLRIDVAVIVGWLALRDQWALTLLPLLPVRDAVAFLLWMISLTGDTVVWRGSSFRLKEGKLNRLDSS